VRALLKSIKKLVEIS